MTEVQMDTTEAAIKTTEAGKNMQVSQDNPVYAFQTIVARAKPDYIVTLHKLLGSFAECASSLKH